MQTDNGILIEEMLALTDHASQAVKKFKELSDDQLNFKKEPQQWNVLECVEHLNRYGDFYLPAIEKAILSGTGSTSASPFRSGLIGNYFANLMKVKNGKISRMKTPTDKNPLGAALGTTTLDRFLKQLVLLRSLLNQARHSDLTTTKVPISLTRFVKLRLGDTFRFFVYHIERHILQAQKMVDLQSED